ncbi:M13 family metallopeptidase [Pseudoalteromonas sp. SR44-5]|uniref:M13 family metallopeptidase n=1 Tax=Pseudoalteromonas TaxID=53246 RepID=UPI001604298D|nr:MULTISPECIES: M13 family metallopeptidase [unclassified Pseudoalteromonas]MBB1333259.1 M13 family metallopeptidase [Pseudoalteromonas sp. SR41-6]MBB1342675.1 M13 family metallopeptidase [Pseudoalteromonas sp. SR45-6]MBB1367340.1 M13 family metallopeptidase [Pseudoalteromonas sp. SR44-5]MBB1418548.1 M13 family metallopeptidase [Pseudoalteromonas sp. SG44-1]MBB1458959.1 M13 family metallopeptidase [Pseudoalteromonas sp. SG41-8]
MKKTLIAATLAATFLTGCSEPKTTQAQQQPSAETQTAKAELGSFGVDLTARNEAIKPGDDFFMYASGTWYDNYVMPADKTRYGAFAGLAERSEERVKAIIEEIAARKDLNTEEKLVADFYNAYMDTDTLNKLGVSPIKPLLTEISNVSSTDDLTKLFGQSWLTGVNSPIGGGMWFNRLDPNKYEMSLGAGGLGLPDRSYYLEDSERFVKTRTAYVAHIADMLKFAGVDNTTERAEAILALETKIAQGQWPREKRRNRDLTLNQIERSELSSSYPDFNWDLYFEQTGYQVPQLNVSQPEPIKAMIALINQEDVTVWKDYLTYHALSSNAELLSEDVFNTNFAFYGKELNGQQEPRPRWKRAISQMSSTDSLGFAIGKVYVARYFPESSKQQMSALVENLRTALGERIDNLDWMGAETKVNARAKLAAFVPKIGYPDVWQSFDGLSISSNDLMGNIKNTREFFRAESAAKELQKTDRNRWGMTPQRVNAYYNSSFNEIVFPAAILQPPFFDPNADPAVNYGGIGAVIGHEMGHGFDDQGSKSDANGVQRNWWTDADRAAFDAKADQLAAQYSQYEPIPGNFVNGRNSLGENIGDVGGLAMAYHAYKLSLNGKEAPIIDGLTGDQRFFLAWAQVWKEKRTEQSMLNQLRGGTHAPGRFRAQAPRNHDAWYKAFNVQPGDALYLPEDQRVRIW